MIPDYQWEALLGDSPQKSLQDWHSKFGPKVISRDNNGLSKRVQFTLLLDNPSMEVFLVGDFNDWGNNNKELFRLIKDEHGLFASIEVECIRHRDKYKFLIEDKTSTYLLQDPAGVYFDDKGNSIFWDYEDPSAYKQLYPFADTTRRTTKIVQTDLPGLISHFANKDGVCGRDVNPREYYKFIAESGVITEIKKLGFNTIQFLPFAQSIDGDNWKLRYLVPFQFAIQKNWGSPDDFAYMIDMFHKEDIAVIGDFVLGHLPNTDYQIFGQSHREHGLHLWKDRSGLPLYLREHTPWGTMRIHFDNPHVRGFFISSCLHFMKYYKVDGFRIDNVDGIIRYGDNGEGDERPSGRVFLREINKAIYDHNPKALIHYEAHYYYEDNAKMLVAPMESDSRALGATAYNSSRLTYYFHTEYMFKSIDEVSVWKFKHISEEKEWGKSNSTVADFHNHDAAAGLMEMRCTGSYAYDAMTVNNKANHVHAVGKIKVMEAIISFFTEGRSLDLIQTHLLQTGTFEHDSSIQWFLTFNEVNRNVLSFKKEINHILDDEAFWPENTKNRLYLNVDDTNKILVVERSSGSSRYVIVVNLSAWVHNNYKVGVRTSKNYKCILNSDSFAYAGYGIATYPEILENHPSTNFEVLDRELNLETLGPYGILVLKEVD